MSEWSKELDSSSSIVRCVGSNPTECTLFLILRVINFLFSGTHSSFRFSFIQFLFQKFISLGEDVGAPCITQHHESASMAAERFRRGLMLRYSAIKAFSGFPWPRNCFPRSKGSAFLTGGI